MRPVHPSRAGLWLGLALALGATGCTEDPDYIDELGTTRIFFSDPDLGPQAVKDPELPIQVAQWTIEAATLFVGADTFDLLVAESCLSADTVLQSPRASGRCSTGLIVGASSEPLEAMLSVRFTMQVRRARPIDLPPLSDHDGDGVINADDTCPLVANADQEIEACSFLDSASGALITDSDDDGVGDSVDNCVYVSNSQQENSSEELLPGVSDGIGDACEEQLAVVMAGGSPTIEITRGDIDYAQPQDLQTFWVVDLSDEETLDCDWEAGTCELDPAAVGVCVVNSLLSAVVGCST